MITGKNELKIFDKRYTVGMKFKFEERKFNSNQKWNNDKN